MQFTKITGPAMQYIVDGGFIIKEISTENNMSQMFLEDTKDINKYFKIDDYYVHYNTFYDEVFPQLTDEEKQKSIKDILYPPKYAKCRRIKRESTILSSSSDSEDDVKEEPIGSINVDEPGEETEDEEEATETIEEINKRLGIPVEDPLVNPTEEEIKKAITDYKKNNPKKTLSELIRYIQKEYGDDTVRKYDRFMRKCRLQFLTSIELPTDENGGSFRIALKDGKKLKFVAGEYVGSVVHVDDWGGISENLHSDAKDIIKDKVTYIS